MPAFPSQGSATVSNLDDGLRGIAEAQIDTAEETAESGRSIVGEIRLLRRDVQQIRMPPVTPVAPRGRILESAP